MKHIKTYNNFDKIDEKLSKSDKRSILFLPNALIGYIGKKLFGIYPLLNLRWKETKRATIGSNHHSPFNVGTLLSMIHELTKIGINDLPQNSLKFSMVFNHWNVYLAKDYKSGNRNVIYISKDEIKKGDLCRGVELVILISIKKVNS